MFFQQSPKVLKMVFSSKFPIGCSSAGANTVDICLSHTPVSVWKLDCFLYDDTVDSSIREGARPPFPA